MEQDPPVRTSWACDPPYRRDAKLLVQWRATEMIEGLEHLSYEDGLKVGLV